MVAEAGTGGERQGRGGLSLPPPSRGVSEGGLRRGGGGAGGWSSLRPRSIVLMRLESFDAARRMSYSQPLIAIPLPLPEGSMQVWYSFSSSFSRREFSPNRRRAKLPSHGISVVN